MTEQKNRRTNPVAKHMEEFNRPSTHLDRKKYKKPKYERPVHEIDPADDYIDEQDVFRD